jgi:signal transduction histidine kinase/CheY-like chemotaxis protein
VKKTSSLRGKIIIATILGVAVLATALVIIMINFMNFLTDTILLETMKPLARSAALSVQGNLHMMADRIFLISGNAVFADPAAARENKQRVLDTAASGIEFIWLGLYTQAGVLEAGTSRSPPVLKYQLYTMMRDTRNLVIDETDAAGAGELEVVVGTPVVSDGEIRYYLAGSYKYDILNDVLSNINISSDSTAYIFNESGKFIAHRDMEKILSTETFFSGNASKDEITDILSRMKWGWIGSVKLRGAGGEKFYAFAPVRGTRWTLAIEASRGDFILATRQGVSFSILITFFLLALFIILSGVYIKGFLSDPLKIITRNAHKLSEGNFSEELPGTPAKRKDEIAQLADTFVSMAGSVKGVIGEIEGITRAARAGRLGQRSRLSTLKGDYLRIVSGVNSTLDVICSQLDAIPEALALFSEKREMLFRNRAMTEFLANHGLESGEEGFLEQIAGGGTSGPLDPRAAVIFDPSVSAPPPFVTDIALLGGNGGSNFILSIQRAGIDSGGVSAGSAGDKAVCVMLILSDVTQLARAKIDAEAASRAKSDFLSRMSHEIRTPLNAITGMTQIAKGTGDVEKIHSCLEQVEKSSNHLLGVINDILDFSKIESGKFALDLAEFSITEDLGFVLSIIQSRANDKNIRVRLNIERIENDGVSTDSLRFNQVLLNLLSNAVKFSPEGSEVLLKVRETDSARGRSTYRFDIVDHGIGISEYHASKLFRPFEQADGSITRNYGGTGLGLVISKNLVEMMGGGISLKSREGEGSTFTFTINCAAKPFAERKISEESEAPAASHDFSGKHCLVVDDIDINREIILELLSETGIELETAENGREALDKFIASAEGYYDIILMDMQMPVLDGCSATTEIRKQKRADAASIPIVAMTANVLEEDIRRAMKSGMTAHLGKPIELDAMYRVFQEQLNPGAQGPAGG